jgi:hypothetical protein
MWIGRSRWLCCPRLGNGCCCARVRGWCAEHFRLVLAPLCSRNRSHRVSVMCDGRNQRLPGRVKGIAFFFIGNMPSRACCVLSLPSGPGTGISFHYLTSASHVRGRGQRRCFGVDLVMIRFVLPCLGSCPPPMCLREEGSGR